MRHGQQTSPSACRRSARNTLTFVLYLFVGTTCRTAPARWHEMAKCIGSTPPVKRNQDFSRPSRASYWCARMHRTICAVVDSDPASCEICDQGAYWYSNAPISEAIDLPRMGLRSPMGRYWEDWTPHRRTILRRA